MSVVVPLQAFSKRALLAHQLVSTETKVMSLLSELILHWITGQLPDRDFHRARFGPSKRAR